MLVKKLKIIRAGDTYMRVPTVAPLLVFWLCARGLGFYFQTEFFYSPEKNRVGVIGVRAGGCDGCLLSGNRHPVTLGEDLLKISSLRLKGGLTAN